MNFFELKKKVIDFLKISNDIYIFNPSIIKNEKNYILIFRVVLNEQRKIFICELNSKYEIINNTLEDLTCSLQNHSGATFVADPKLFKFKDDIYFTFNDGYREKNNIYIVKLNCINSIKINAVYKCVKKNRQSIEKNWIFFENKINEHPELCAIYSVSPFTVLKFKFEEKTVACYFEKKYKFIDSSLILNNSLVHLCSSCSYNEHLIITYSKIKKKETKKAKYSAGLIFVDKEKLLNLTEIKYTNPFFELYENEKNIIPQKTLTKYRIEVLYLSGILKEKTKLKFFYGINDFFCGVRDLELNFISQKKNSTYLV
tara:strand:+ start:4907 stop:5848 length:942 start_codon:yes stop_codon:yes gene_type:complete